MLFEKDLNDKLRVSNEKKMSCDLEEVKYPETVTLQYRIWYILNIGSSDKM